MTHTATATRLEDLWHAHHGAVLAYARRRIDAEAAADVAAETFAVAWRRIGDAPDEPLPWLYGIARRVLANRRRGDGRRAALIDRIRREPAAAAPDPADLVGDDLALRGAFAALSARDRELLVLTAWEGLAPAQIAVVLGIPTALVSSRLHRARRRLRAGLDADGPAAATTITTEEP